MSQFAGTPTRTQQVDSGPGTFEDGKWLCACNPPLQANFYLVKNPKSKRVGQWFWRCPKPQGTQCNFLLFEDDARVRENKILGQKSVHNVGTTNGLGATNTPGAISSMGAGNNLNPGPGHARNMTSRAETPQSEVASTISGGPLHSPMSSVFPTVAPWQSMFRGIPREPGSGWSSDEDSDATADGGRQHHLNRYPDPATPSSKRKRPAVEGPGQGGHADLSDLDPDDDRELMQMADRSERLQRFQESQSSQHSQLSDAPAATPTRHGTRTGFGGLPTPATGNSFFAAPSSEIGSKRVKTGQGLADAITPTPARVRDALAPGAPGADRASWQGQQQQGGPKEEEAEEEEDADITKEVLDILKGQPVSAAVRRTVRERLNRHARVVRGVQMGRDATREALKESKVRNAALQARVVELEDERKMRRAVLRSDLEALSQEVEE